MLASISHVSSKLLNEHQVKLNGGVRRESYHYNPIGFSAIYNRTPVFFYHVKCMHSHSANKKSRIYSCLRFQLIVSNSVSLNPLRFEPCLGVSTTTYKSITLQLKVVYKTCEIDRKLKLDNMEHYKRQVHVLFAH